MGPKDPLLTHTGVRIIFQSGNLMKAIFGKCCSDKFLLCWPQPLLLLTSPALCSWGTVENLHIHSGIAWWFQGVLTDPVDLLLTPLCAAGRGERSREFGNLIGSYTGHEIFVFLLPGFCKWNSC